MDGIATTSPMTVVRSAPEIPGATADNIADPLAAIPPNESITPQTVPSRPSSGADATEVARKPILSSSESASSAVVLSATVSRPLASN